MDKRYQVFVSSTFQDLVDERRHIMQALLELDCIPAGMELFPASDDDQWTLIKQVIDDSDYYVVLVGGRYGSVDDTGLSFTEREFDYAVETGKPILGFVHKDPGSIPAGRTEMNPAARERLEAFRNKVQQRMCKFWTTAEELGGLVSRSLVKLLKTHPAVGWIRASEAATADVLARLNELKVENADLKLAMERSTFQPPEGHDSLAQGSDRFTWLSKAIAPFTNAFPTT